MQDTIKTTIDSAGRLVIPKTIRAEAGLLPGTSVEISYREGHIEIEVPARGVRIVRKGRLHVAVPLDPPEPTGELLSVDAVRGILERVRSRPDRDG